MDTVDEIVQKATELGKSIAMTDVYREFKQAEYELFHDADARKLVEDLHKKKQEFHGKQMAGIELTEEESNSMKELEQACIRNRQVLRSNGANTRFQEFMEEISANIKNGIKSVESGK